MRRPKRRRGSSLRAILHLDLDAFYCAVEEGRDPSLSGVAFAVGGAAEGRGVVCSCSYAARQWGVRSAMPMGRARALCPGLRCLPADFPAYRAASARVMERLRALTPHVEQISIDEAFLDVSDLGAPGRDDRPERFKRRCGTSWACPVRSDWRPTNSSPRSPRTRARRPSAPAPRPKRLCEVPAGGEAAFLAPLPAGALWGVGPKTEERLLALGIATIGDIAAWPADDLARRFGQHGRDLSRHARGLDDREIVTGPARQVVLTRDDL